MNAPIAFHLAEQAMSDRGASTPERPRRRRRRAPRLSRLVLVVCAAVAMLLGALGADALGEPNGSGATSQPGDGFARAASGKSKPSAGTSARKRRSEPGAKKKGKGKPGAKKKGKGKPGGRKKVKGKPGGKKRGRRPLPLELFYTAEITGTAKYEYTDSSSADHPEVEYTSDGSGRGSASLRAARARVDLIRLAASRNNGPPFYPMGFNVIAEGEVFNGLVEESGRGVRNKYNRAGCSPGTASTTEPGPSPIALEVKGVIGLAGQGPRVIPRRSGPTSSTTMYSAVSCTRADGTPDPHPPSTATGGGGVVLYGCNNSSGAGGPEVTSVASGEVAWGRAFTISVTCKEEHTAPTGHLRTETRLTIALRPCPGRGTRPCQ